MGNVFGGYTNIFWNSFNGYVTGNGLSFLFSITRNTKHNCINNFLEICHNEKSGPIFGDDLIISDDCNNNKNN